MFEILQGYLAEFTYAGIFLVLFLCGLGLPVPEDIPILVSGYLAHLGAIRPWPGLAVNLAGVLIGDLVIYSFGYWMGPRALRHRLLRLVMTPRRAATVNRFFTKHGKKAVFFGRFVAGLRAPIFLAAGIARLHPRTFILMDGTAALITVPALYFLAYYFGEQLDVLRGFLGSTKKAAALLLGAVLILWLAKRRVMRWWRERGTPAA
ncbi:MAG: DedA family protein [Nitrospinota bacterium]